MSAMMSAPCEGFSTHGMEHPLSMLACCCRPLTRSIIWDLASAGRPAKAELRQKAVRGRPEHLLASGKSSIDYTFERIVWGHGLLRSCRQGPLGRPATAMMLKSAGTCLPILGLLSRALLFSAVWLLLSLLSLGCVPCRQGPSSWLWGSLACTQIKAYERPWERITDSYLSACCF